jgi:hypothetical protein
MTAFEKLGLFYLGRRRDHAAGTTLQEPVLYDAGDLVTHAVCVGMTGSGKTGLCIGLIEEAAIDGIPVIAIDPKGDLGNLLLTFPALRPSDFRPWIDEEAARRASVSADEFAAQEAERWAAGLAAWGQDGARIDRLKTAAEFAIFTPGSRAGRPVSIVSSFAPPASAAGHDLELLAERASTTATSALALAGVEAAPRSREHTLVSSLLLHAWKNGQTLDFAALVRQVQSPPFDTVGVVDLESFFPAKDRLGLSMQINGVLAAPGFAHWLEGAPLDPSTLFYTAEGKPRVSVLSIAHLGDTERMLVVSLLLSALLDWTRRQGGTSSLRAMLYMDEVFGYLPPVANPPSKAPLLTLLKQARAFGVGIVLATQNPVDLDYKGLSNTGTWFLGKLQTERDKARVLDGLEGAAPGFERSELDRQLSALTKRIFFMHNVHETAPTVFETRWTLSYLRGPLSRDQIRTLMSEASADDAPSEQRLPPDPPAAAAVQRSGGERPVVPPGIQEFFLPVPDAWSGPIEYEPVILGAARVRFSDRSLGVDATRDVLYVTPVSDDPVPVDWSSAARVDVGLNDLQRSPAVEALFAPLPAVAVQPAKYTAWSKAFARWMAQHETLELLRHVSLATTSRAGESERDFRIRLQEQMRIERAAAVDAVRAKYAAKQAAFAERLRRADAAIEREQQQSSDQKLQTAVSMGATLLGAFLGRKAVSSSTLGRATTAARGVGRSMKEASDVKRAAEGADAVRAQMRSLESQIAADMAAVAARYEHEAPLERVVIAPKRGQVEVQLVALAWRR